MKTVEKGAEISSLAEPQAFNLLLVGNNPMELGDILEKIQRAADKRKIITEIAFDLKSLFARIEHFEPNYILIDDNIGKPMLSEAIKSLSEHKKTKDIPVTVLKNSNYEESTNSNSNSNSVLDYVLKQSLSAESILNSLRNTLKLRRTQLYLHKAYMLRKNQLLGAIS